MSQSSPLHTLPPEILIEIILWDVRNWTDVPGLDRVVYVTANRLIRFHYARVYRLSSVCTSWKALIDATPQFWTKISSSLPPRISERFLEKSGSAPLEITYELDGNEPIWLRKQFEPHFGRVGKLFLDVSQNELPAKPLPDFTATNLETLEITCWNGCHENPIQPVLTIFDPALPRLRRLLHQGAPITLNWSSVSTLTHLDIQKCNTQWFGHDDWALFVLQNNPGLVSVHLSQLLQTHHMPTAFPKPIHLDHLKRLSLVDNSNEITQRIVSALVSPACVYAHIDFRDGVEWASLNWSEGRESLAHSIILRPHSRVHVDLSVMTSQVLKVDLDDSTVFTVKWSRNEPIRPALHWITRLCTILSKSEIKVSLCFVDTPVWQSFDLSTVWDDLACVPHVTALRFVIHGPEAVVDFLLRDPPVLPELKTLWLDHAECTSDFMIPILQYRNADVTVARLSKLTIKSEIIDSEPPEILKQLLGDAKLVWRKKSHAMDY